MSQSELNLNCGRWRARNLQSYLGMDRSLTKSPARFSLHLSFQQIGYAAPPWLKGLAVLLLILSVTYILVMLSLNLMRAHYPFELEWTEGAVIEEIRWILSGKPLYSTPDIHFLPLAYNPLYFYIAALPSKVLGGGYLAPRLISILANLGVLILLFRVLVSANGNWGAGLIAAGISAASFRATGAWVDLAKTDSLFLLWIMVGFLLLLRYQLNYAKETQRPVTKFLALTGTALLFCLAYYTKQTALPILTVLATTSLLLSRGRTWPVWLLTSLLIILIFFIQDTITLGWFSFYTVDILATHERVSLWRFWETLLPKFWPALIIGVIFCISFVRRSVITGNAYMDAQFLRQSENKTLIYEKNTIVWMLLGLVLALILASWTIYTKAWTYTNGLMPVAAGLALVCGMAFGEFANSISNRSQSQGGSFQAISSYRLPLAVLLLLLLQFGLLYYNPFAQLPTHQDRRAAEKFVRQLSRLPGEVWLFSHGVFNSLAGKTTYLHSVALGDVLGGTNPAKSQDTINRRLQVQQMFDDALQSQTFQWIITDKPEQSWLPYYLWVDTKIPGAPAILQTPLGIPVTGAPSRPETLMIRNPVTKGGIFPLMDPNLAGYFSDAWTDSANSSNLNLRLAQSTPAEIQIALESKHAYVMLMVLHPICQGDPETGVITSNSTLPLQILIGWNNSTLAEISLETCSPNPVEIFLPASLVTGSLDRLWFDVQPDPDSAIASDMLTTSRLLFALQSLEFVQGQGE